MVEHDAYLLIQIQAPVSPEANALWAHLENEAGDACLICAASSEILEQGSPDVAVFLARWAEAKDRDAFWQSNSEALRACLNADNVRGCALAAPGVLHAGDPDDPELPCRADSLRITGGSPGLMLVQGSVTDPDPILKYRDMIRPLLRENKGYYIIYTFADAVTVLAGNWSEQALIVSIWPSEDHARAFWYCDTYQDVAIPTRVDAGVFTVNLFPALRGD